MSEISLTPAESNAIADLLFLAIYADDHISEKEDDELVAKASKIGGNFIPSHHMMSSIAKARSVAPFADQRSAYLRDTVAKLSPAAKELALSSVASVLKSDGMGKDEGGLLAEITALLA